MRFIKQPTNYSCGPTALYNLLIWANQHRKELTFRKIHQMCDCQLPNGTQFNKFNQTLNEICRLANIKLNNFIVNPLISQITNQIDNGGVVLLEFHWENKGENGEHYVLLLDRNSEGINMVNSDGSNSKQPVVEFVSNRKIKTMLMPYEYAPNTKYSDPFDNIYPKVWFLSK